MEEILQVRMVLAQELIHQLFIVTVYGSPRKPWSHPPPSPPPCGLFFTSSFSLFFLFHYYDGGHTTHYVKMGELAFELMSSQHCDYCRNARWSTMTDFYTCTHIWGRGGENRTMIVRSPAGGRKITRRWSDGNRPICGHRPEIARSPEIPQQWPSDNARKTGRWQLRSADHRPDTRRWPSGGRWASAQSCSRLGESAGDLPMSENRHPATNGKKSGGHRTIYKACDVGFSKQTNHSTAISWSPTWCRG